MAKRRYSDEERANALAALAANAGNVAATARQLGIPGKTLEHWAKGERHPEAAKMGEEKRGPMADELERVAWRLLDAIPGKIKDAPLNQVATSMGIAIDKARLLRGEPTEIADRRHDPLLLLLRQRYAEADAADHAAAGAGGPAGGQPLPPPGPDDAAAAVPAAGVP